MAYPFSLANAPHTRDQESVFQYPEEVDPASIYPAQTLDPDKEARITRRIEDDAIPE